jgi:hypothetical protein
MYSEKEKSCPPKKKKKKRENKSTLCLFRNSAICSVTLLYKKTKQKQKQILKTQRKIL